MRKFIIVWMSGLAVTLALLPVLSKSQAQGQADGNRRSGADISRTPEVTAGPGWKTAPRAQSPANFRAARVKYKVDGHAFNPHDLSGVWGNDGIKLDATKIPPMTAYGKQLWEATQATSPDPSIKPQNGGPGGKDPMMHCDPLGYPRALSYSYGMEFEMLPDRVMQLFEWGSYHRVIWTDGRKLPADPPEPRWFGYNVGHWEGDTFVIESNGYEDRSWLDEDRRPQWNRSRGIPHSDQMTITERWKRTSYENIEVEITIKDPKVFTAPWVSKAQDTLRPGVELSEYHCVPSDSEAYNRDQIYSKK